MFSITLIALIRVVFTLEAYGYLLTVVGLLRSVVRVIIDHGAE